MIITSRKNDAVRRFRDILREKSCAIPRAFSPLRETISAESLQNPDSG